MFDTGGWTAVGLSLANRQTVLKPLSEAAPDALRLQYFVVERPAGDPLLGDELWDEMCTTGALDPKRQRSLADQGIRVGVTSTAPPEALQKLLGEAKEITDAQTPEDARRRNGQTLVLPSGGQTEAQTSDTVANCALNVESDGKSELKTFEQARGVFRVTATSKQEGWATLEFLPEVHYGAVGMRTAAGDAGWKQTYGQAIHKLYDQRFELTLSEGETAVVTALGDDPDRAGRLFFRTTADGVPVQRMLVVRLVRTGEKPAETKTARTP